jgi:hypothetical protein
METQRRALIAVCAMTAVIVMGIPLTRAIARDGSGSDHQTDSAGPVSNSQTGAAGPAPTSEPKCPAPAPPTQPDLTPPTSVPSTNPYGNCGRRGTWAPPALQGPETITVRSGTTSLKLQGGKDYKIVMPPTPLRGTGLSITGGRNVVMIGGTIEVNSKDQEGHARGLYLIGQTATVHIDGLHVTGSALFDGIVLDQRLGATVQLQNIRIDTVHGSRSGDHADLVQTWAGPVLLRIDGLTGRTTYQGFFLMPRQRIKPGGPLTYTGPLDTWDFRNINIVGTASSAYLLWRNPNHNSIRIKDVFVGKEQGGRTDQMAWPSPKAWLGVSVGRPTDFVPAGSVGAGYPTCG